MDWFSYLFPNAAANAPPEPPKRRPQIDNREQGQLDFDPRSTGVGRGWFADAPQAGSSLYDPTPNARTPSPYLAKAPSSKDFDDKWIDRVWPTYPARMQGEENLGDALYEKAGQLANAIRQTPLGVQPGINDIGLRKPKGFGTTPDGEIYFEY